MTITPEVLLPARNIVKIVSGRNISELSRSEILYCIKLFYDSMNHSKFNGAVRSRG